MTAATAPLADFLLDRLAEDEAAARAASPGPWHADAEGTTVLAVDDIEVCDGFALSGPQMRATTAHIARHDPARVLREVEAKRRIVEEHAPVDHSRLGMRSPNACSLCGADLYMSGWEWDEDSYPCPTLRALAAVYADHPDFRQEWA